MPTLTHNYENCVFKDKIDKITTMEADIAYIKKSVDRLSDNIESIETKLFIGNGTPSFKSEIESLKQREMDRGKRYDWWLGIVSVIVGGLLLQILINNFEGRTSKEPTKTEQSSHK